MDNPFFGVPVVDARSYDQWAKEMVEGTWLWQYVNNYLPIYPAFLAVQQIIFGTHPLVNKILQSLMGSLSALLLAQVAARAWNRQIGLIAGYLLATHWMLVIFESEKFAEPFSIFCFGLTLYLVTRFSARVGAISAAGFTFALSAGVRANLFLLFPFIIGWLLWYHRHVKKMAVKSALLFSLGTVVIIGPIVFRNYQITGIPMLRAQAGWSLYSGLAPEFKGLHPPDGILFQKYMHMPDQAGLRSPSEIEHFWFQRLREVMRRDPFGVGLNFIRRVLIFLNAREWSQEIDVYTYRSYARLLALPWTGFWLIGPFGILGFFLCRRINMNRGLLIGSALLSIISIIPFKASDRYRLPASALLAVFAALALWQLYRWIRTNDKRALAAAIPVLLVLGFVCWPDWPNLNDRKIARFHFELGLHYEMERRYELALRAYELSMQEFAWDPDSPHRIGAILVRLGQFERAEFFLQEALRREPLFPGALNQMARIRVAQGQLQAAEKYLADSLKLAPSKEETLLLMADLQQRIRQ
jgi:tetratricopeptide (TPR) repeat protein